jgi:hypothetical protein
MTRAIPPQSVEPWVYPDEDRASMAGLELAPAIEAVARQLREQHLAKRLAETEETTATKVAKWNRGESTPQGAGHRKK